MNWDWIAGFYEGEGCPTWNNPRYGSRAKYLRIIIVQKDKRILFQIAARTHRYAPHIWPRRVKGKTRSWMLVYDMPFATPLAVMLLRHMKSPHKIQQLRDAMAGNFHKA